MKPSGGQNGKPQAQDDQEMAPNHKARRLSEQELQSCRSGLLRWG